MNSSSLLKSKFYDLAKQNPDELEFDEEGEYIRVFHHTEWVQIILSRKKTEPDILSIEVEITPPILEINGDNEEMSEGFTSRSILDGTILHLQYLRKLNEKGFKLELVGQDGLWAAYYTVNKTPADDLFECLVPPC